MNPVANQTDPLPNFEESLRELESIVEKMEGSELSLEQALQQFEHGIALARQCQQALNQAEQRIQLLMGEQDLPSQLFSPED